MYRLIKLISIPVISVILILLFYFSKKQSETVIISIQPGASGLEIIAQVPSGQSENMISAYNAGQDNYFLFLPSYTLDQSVKVVSSGLSTAIPDENSDYMTAFHITPELSLYFDNKYTLTILTGSEIPTAFLKLKHDLSYITSDKNLSDSGTVTLISPESDTIYSGELESISGRGNSSWEQDKKPFNIELSDKVSLFGMNSSQTYSLITSTDLSFLRNRISNEMAVSMGSFVLKRTLVNLYVNDVYQGIYEFSEKVTPENLLTYNLEQETKELNLQKNTAQLTTNECRDDWNHSITGKWWDYPDNPEDISGGYILEADDALRYENEASGFILDSGAYIVSKSPAHLTGSQYEYISSYIQTCENAMTESVGLDNYNALSGYIDIRSFVTRYLVEEVSKNIDSSTSSQYFCKDSNGLLCAGPPWDFDWAYGVTRTYNDIDFMDPEGFSARNIPGPLVWWQLLYYNNAFYSDVVTTYQNTLFPWLNQLTGKYLYEWENELIDSSVMDYIRWDRANTTDLTVIRESYHDQITSIADFLNLRKEFLYQEWITAGQE